MLSTLRTSRSRGRFLCLLLTLATLPWALRAARAASGDPDPSFGTGGVVTLSGALLFPSSLVLQNDGRIIVAARPPGVKVARFDPDGTLDATFGVGGIAQPALGTVVVSAIAVQPDGSIVLAGSSYSVPALGFFAVARLDPSGAPDPAFGTSGLVTVDFGPPPGPGPTGGAVAVAVQPDGRIVASGTVTGIIGTVLVRLDADGTLDAGFDGDGIAVSPFVLNLGGGYAGLFDDGPRNHMALQVDGGIVLGAGSALGVGTPNVAAVRQTAGGLPDTSFGASGIVTLPVLLGRPRPSKAEAVALQADGRILLAGEIGSGLPTTPPFEPRMDAAVVRLLADGSLDPSFRRSGGIRLRAGRRTGAGFVGTQSDEKIVVVGNWATRSQGGLAAFRLTSDGRRDRSFGRGGKIRLDGAVVIGAALQPDDRLVVAADTNAGTWELRRFLP